MVFKPFVLIRAVQFSPMFVLILVQLFYGCGSLLMDLGSIAYLSDGGGLNSLYQMSKI